MFRYILLILTIVAGLSQTTRAKDYKQSPDYLTLRDSMHHAFNNGDSLRFFSAVKDLENYLLAQDDLHAYYTQRCNEIVFLMNSQKIYEAYKLARQLSQELREKKLDKEMYMAYNMLGHINRICGNKEAAKENFYKVIKLMEREGYYESMPPIFMNIVNVEINDDPEEALELLNRAKEISEKYAPERVFDIETRRTLSYYNQGDIPKFLEGYKAYKEGEKQGKSSVHGRSLEVYYLASQGRVDEAVASARKHLGDDSDEIVTLIYEKAGRWREAYESLRKEYQANDSINNVVLSNSMQGIRDELTLYSVEHEAAKSRLIALTAIIALLLLLILALVYITFSRRSHMRQLKRAYQHALESDKMKTAFIQNISHEVRTPLNIIGGFAQVIADPELTSSVKERQDMAAMMQKSAQQVTNLIDEIIGLSMIDATTSSPKDDTIEVNKFLKTVVDEYKTQINPDTVIVVDSQLADDFMLNTNTNMLRRILNAVTENAIKNTERGTITLKASADTQTLAIAIEDTGCGIPAAEAEHIFDRFVKLDSFKEGIGLGLPLSRKLAEQLGGTIRLDTSYTGGARFILQLPISL